MTGAEHEALLVEVLGNLDNQARITEILDNLRTDYSETLASVETLNTNNTNMLNEVNNLRTVNNKLFLKLGDTSDFSTNPPVVETTQATQEPELKYENLWDEKGRLK